MPGTTPRGYPYPLPTEPVAEGAAAIRALAERIDSNSALEMIESKTLAVLGGLPFTAIPQIYRALYLHLYVKGGAVGAAGSLDNLRLQVNGYTGAGYQSQKLYAQGTTVAASAEAGATSALISDIGDSTMIAAPCIAYFPLYASAIPHHWQAEGSTAQGRRSLCNGQIWGQTTPITSMYLFAQVATTLAIGSTASLYGLK